MDVVEAEDPADLLLGRAARGDGEALDELVEVDGVVPVEVVVGEEEAREGVRVPVREHGGEELHELAPVHDAARGALLEGPVNHLSHIKAT